MFLVGGGWVLWQKVRIPVSATSEGEKVMQNVLRMWAIEKRTESVRRKDGESESKQASLWTRQYDAKDRQIPREQVWKNVFAMASPPAVVEKTTVADTGEESKTSATEVQKPKAPPVSHLHLQSVLMGDQPSAMISGYLVHRGQSIDGWSVEKIQLNQIVLRWQNETYVIKMP